MNLSQNVISSKIKHAPNVYAFTEQGVAMLSSVLRSRKAIQVNIVIMRAFVELRKFITTHKGIEIKLKEIEDKVDKHDMEIQDIFEAIRLLIGIPQAKKVIKGFAQK